MARPERRVLHSTESRLKLLVDTNVFIAAEPYGDARESTFDVAAGLFATASRLGHSIVISRATQADLLQGSGEQRRTRLDQLRKYHVLEEIPENPQVRIWGGFPLPLSDNDRRDVTLLNDLCAGAADFLVTDDRRLRNRAIRVVGEKSVLSLVDAFEMLSRLDSRDPGLRRAHLVQAYRLDPRSPIFDSIRCDYPEFDVWFRDRVVYEGRQAVVVGAVQNPEGIAILKREPGRVFDLPSPTLKLCTFKVAEEHAGSRRGELLLESVLRFARENAFESIYVECFPSRTEVLQFLGSFGFETVGGGETDKGELTLAKVLVCQGDSDEFEPLEYHVRFGPGAMKLKQAHIVPIKPNFHAMLFPEAEIQQELFPTNSSYGNAIRKAYLCHARSRRVNAGDTLVFLRTEGHPSLVSAIGVAEQTLATRDPEELIRFVGNRTVYSQDQVYSMCADDEVLAILFRLDRLMASAITSPELREAGVIRGTVQSIQQVRGESIEWMKNRLGA